MDIMSQFNLPKYLKGKSFSEASKLIADRFKDRNTPEDVATLKELQGRLQSAQEFVKAKQQVNVPQEGQEQPMHQMPDGTMMPGATHAEAPQAMQDMPQGDAYGYGGYKKSYAYGGKMDRENAANKYEHGGPHFGELSKFLEGANGLLNKGVDSSKLNGLDAAQYIQNDGLGNKEGWRSNSSDQWSFTPGKFGGQSMAPRSLASYIPGATQLNPNIVEPKKSNETLASPEENSYIESATQNPMQSSAFPSRFSKPITDLVKGVDFAPTLGQPKADTFGGEYATGIGAAGEATKSTFSGNDTDEGVNKSRQSKFNPGELLRYAAPASTAYQLANLKKPKDVSLGRLTDKYDEQFVDEKAMQNVVEGQAANTRSALQNASGGSAAALRANLLGSQVQSQAAMSQAYNQASAENRNERKAGQQFNSAVNQANMQQADRETEMNLVQQAGYDTNKSRLLAQLGADASGIGQEELFKRFPELAGLGYDYRGKKIKTK